MSNPIFKVLKYSYYSGGKKNLEQYEISMYGNDGLCVYQKRTYRIARTNNIST